MCIFGISISLGKGYASAEKIKELNCAEDNINESDMTSWKRGFIMSNTILEAKSITKKFDERNVLNEVSLSVEKGQYQIHLLWEW